MSENYTYGAELIAAYSSDNKKEINRLIKLGATFPEGTAISALHNFDLYYYSGKLVQSGDEKEFFYLLDSDNVTIEDDHAYSSFCSDAINAQKFEFAVKLMQHPKASLRESHKKELLNALATTITKDTLLFERLHTSNSTKLFGNYRAYKALLGALTDDHDPAKEKAFQLACFKHACEQRNSRVAAKTAQDDFKLTCSIELQVEIESYCASYGKENDRKLLPILLKHIEWTRYAKESFVKKAIETNKTAFLHDFVDSENAKLETSDTQTAFLSYALQHKDTKLLNHALSNINAEDASNIQKIHLRAYAFDAVDMLPEALQQSVENFSDEQKADFYSKAITICIENDHYQRAHEILGRHKEHISFSAEQWEKHTSYMLEQGQSNFAYALLETFPEGGSLHRIKYQVPTFIGKIGQYAPQKDQQMIFDRLYSILGQHDYLDLEKNIQKTVTEAIYEGHAVDHLLDHVETLPSHSWERTFSWSTEIDKAAENYKTETLKKLLDKCDKAPEELVKSILKHKNHALMAYLAENHMDSISPSLIFTQYACAIAEDNTSLIKGLQPMYDALNGTEGTQKAKEQAVYDVIYDSRYKTSGLVKIIQALESKIGLPKTLQEERRKGEDPYAYLDTEKSCLVYQMLNSDKQVEAATYLVEQGCAFRFNAVTKAIPQNDHAQFGKLLTAMVNSPYADIISDNANELAHAIRFSALSLSHIHTLLDTGFAEKLTDNYEMTALHEHIAELEGQHGNYDASEQIYARIKYLKHQNEVITSVQNSQICAADESRRNQHSKEPLKDAFANIFCRTAETPKPFMNESNKPHLPQHKGPRR